MAASLEKRVSELEWRIGQHKEQRVIMVRFVKVAMPEDSRVETLSLMDDSKMWMRGAEETEVEFMRRVQSELPRSGPVLLVAESSS